MASINTLSAASALAQAAEWFRARTDHAAPAAANPADWTTFAAALKRGDAATVQALLQVEGLAVVATEILGEPS